MSKQPEPSSPRSVSNVSNDFEIQSGISVGDLSNFKSAALDEKAGSIERINSLDEKTKLYRKKIDEENESKLSSEDEELKHKLRVDIYKSEVEKIQVPNQTPSLSKQDHDIAVIAYYQSLDELREFYRSRIANSEKKSKEYEIKLHDLDAKILQHRADEVRNQDRKDREGGARQAEAKARLAKAQADKLRQEDKRADKIAKANEHATQYKETIKVWHENFLSSLEGLEPKQKKAKFLAHFLENSADMYIRNYNSVAEQKEDIQKQFSLLLSVPKGDQDLVEVAKKIEANLPSYIKQMDNDLGKKLSMHGASDHFRENILNDSLYAITAKRLNKIVDASIGLSVEKKEEVSEKTQSIIMPALKYMTGGSLISNVYQKIMHKYNKFKAIDNARKLGITDAHEIISRQPTPIVNKGKEQIVR